MTNASERISARLLRPLVGALLFAGHAPDAVFERSGLELGLLQDGDPWIPLQSLLTAWRLGEALLPGELGLRLVEAVDFRFFGQMDAVTEYLLVQLLTTSATVGEGLARLDRYAVTTFGALSVDVARSNEGVTVQLLSPGPSLPCQFAHFALAYPLRALIQCSARALVPAEVLLPGAPPPSLERAARLFGTPPRFGAATPAFRLSAADLDLPLLTARPERAAAVRERAEALLGKLMGAQPFSVQVRDRIRAALPEGCFGAAGVAGSLGISVRTLSRRLDAEGTSHREILENVRAGRARELLEQSTRSVEEIALELGFSEPSSFHRASRRWFGQSPSALRRGSPPTPAAEPCTGGARLSPKR